MPNAVSVCGKNPNWTTDPDRYFTFGGELKISDRNCSEVDKRITAIFKKSLETTKFMVAKTGLELLDKHRIILRFFDCKDHTRGVMLPGLMIFINGTVVEFNNNQAEQLYPGEFDMTESVCDLGKFKLEAHWCAKEDVKNTTYGWGIYIAYPSSLKKLESEDSSDEEDYILNAGDKKKYKPRSKRRSPSAESSSSSSSADVITSSQERIVDSGSKNKLYSKSPQNRFRSRSPLRREQLSPVRREYERVYDQNRNYDRDAPEKRNVQEKQRASYDKYYKKDVYENGNERSKDDPDSDYDREMQLKQNRKEIERFLAIIDEPHDISQEFRERIQEWLREKSKETVRMFFNEILERYPYEQYVFHKQKSYLICDMFTDPDFSSTDKRHMARKILKDDKTIKDVILKQFSKNVFVKIIKHCADEHMAIDVFEAIKDDFKFICQDKIGNYALQDILKEGMRMEAYKYIDLMLDVLRRDSTAFRHICFHNGGSHVIQSLITMMSDSKLIEMVNLLVGKDEFSKDRKPKTELLKELVLDNGSGFFVIEKLVNQVDADEVEDVIEVLMGDDEFDKISDNPVNGQRFSNLMRSICQKIGNTFLDSHRDVLEKFLKREKRD